MGTIELTLPPTVAETSKNATSVRPDAPPPSTRAALSEREVWAAPFVSWFLSATGGDPDIDGVPLGYRWRMEYFDCVRDPQAFEKYAEEEISAYRSRENA